MSESHSHSHGDHGHSHDHGGHHDHSKQKKIYWVIFVALLVGTVITVALNYQHFDSMAKTIAIALFVAVVKASLVAGFFMHLISEKKAIYTILASTVFFFVAMMYLFIWSRDQMPAGTEYLPTKYVPVAMTPGSK